MKTKLLASLIALAAWLALAFGCVAPPSKSATARANESAKVQTKSVPLVFDDPEPVFDILFPNGLALKKDRLETEAEFAARLASTGLSEKEFTWLIPPALCDVLPFPDNDFYVIVSKDSYFETRYASVHRKPTGFSVKRYKEKTSSFTGQNAYGATTEATLYSAFDAKIFPVGFESLPSILKWVNSSTDPTVKFGLPVRTADPSFRSKLKEKKIGLAVRVRIGDLSQLGDDYMGTAPTLHEPTGISIGIGIIPVHLLEMWVVDTETSTSVVHWSPHNLAIQ